SAGPSGPIQDGRLNSHPTSSRHVPNSGGTRHLDNGELVERSCAFFMTLKKEMEAQPRPEGAFDLLRPYCVQLTLEHTVENVRRLHSQISSMEVSAIQGLLEYVLFPLRFSLKTSVPKKPGFVEAVLQCISYVLSISTVNSEVTLLEMFHELLDYFPPDKLKAMPEELKLAMVSAMRSLFRASGRDIRPALYKQSMLPKFAVVISTLLKFAEFEKSRELRLEALNCLEALILLDVKQVLTGDMFASFIPGLCTVLTRIICGDPIQGYRLTTTAMHLWSGAVCIVLSDESLAQVPEEKTEVTAGSKEAFKPFVHRDIKWVKNTTSHLFHHLDKIIDHCSIDSNWKVRMALIDLGHLLITQCWNSMAEELGTFLKIFVGHSSDERPEVKARAQAVLQDVTKDCPASRPLGDVLSENLHMLSVTLPRLLSSQDDNKKIHILTHLLGYLELLGPRIKFTLHSGAHLKRLSTALLQTLELDFNSVRVVEERMPPSASPLKNQIPTLAGAPQKHFRYFRDPRVLCFIQRVCRMLGYFGDFHLLSDHFLRLYRAQMVSSVIMLNQLVIGAAGINVETLHGGIQVLNEEEMLDVVRPILEEYVDPSNWVLHTCHSVDELGDHLASLQLGSPSKPALQNIISAWRLCLQMEGISCFAQVLGIGFRPLLITVLYPLLERAGDHTTMVTGAALLALSEVSSACGYDDVSQLIELNADYLASEISVGLRRLLQGQGGAASVFCAMLENSGPNLLPLLRDLVQDLLSVLDQSQDDLIIQLFPVLNSLMKYIERCLPSKTIAVDKECAALASKTLENSGSLAKEIKAFLRNHIEQKRIASGDVEEEESTDVLPPELANDEDEKPPLAIHIQISKEVAEKCAHFLSHGDSNIRIQALDTLRLALISLQSEENVMLPLAHKIWPSLVKRLVKGDPMLMLRAFQVFVWLASSCKDFLRMRMSKEVHPVFLKFLRSHAEVSCHAGNTYNHTQNFKLQVTILEGLGTICISMKLDDSDLLEVADSCILYLNIHQPQKLQEAASSAFITLAKLDPDLMWLYLSQWQNPPAAPHSTLIKPQWTARTHDEYTQNVLKLLRQIQ
ncbi:TELO2-interacting protein 1 homolog, partial [Pelodytes ibericus]